MNPAILNCLQYTSNPTLVMSLPNIFNTTFLNKKSRSLTTNITSVSIVLYSSLCSRTLRSLRSLRFNHSNATGIDITSIVCSEECKSSDFYEDLHSHTANQFYCGCSSRVRRAAHLTNTPLAEKFNSPFFPKMAPRN